MKLKYANGKRVSKAEEFEFFRQVRFFESLCDAMENVERDQEGNIMLWSAVNCMRARNIKFELISSSAAFSSWMTRDSSIPIHPAIIDFDEDKSKLESNSLK